MFHSLKLRWPHSWNSRYSTGLIEFYKRRHGAHLQMEPRISSCWIAPVSEFTIIFGCKWHGCFQRVESFQKSIIMTRFAFNWVSPRNLQWSNLKAHTVISWRDPTCTKPSHDYTFLKALVTLNSNIYIWSALDAFLTCSDLENTSKLVFESKKTSSGSVFFSFSSTMFNPSK